MTAAKGRKLYKVDVAAFLGYGGKHGPRPQHVNRLGLPAPDGTDIDRGHARPWWWERTIREWMPTRPSASWARQPVSAED